MPTKKTTRKTAQNGKTLTGAIQPATPEDGFPAESLQEDSLTEDRMAQVRQNLEAEQSTAVQLPKTGGLGQFLGKADKTSSIDERAPLEISEIGAPEQLPASPPVQGSPVAPRKLYPFEPDEPSPNPADTKQLPTFSPRQTAAFGRRPTGGTKPLSANKSGTTSPLNILAHRLDMQGETPLNRLQNMSERKQLPAGLAKETQLNNQDNRVQPLGAGNVQSDGGGADGLALKIKNGTVPGETLNLLIRPSTTEAEVYAICKTLNVDWDLVPGENRKEKTHYLINYFNNRETHLNYQEVAPAPAPAPPPFMPSYDQDWSDLDARLTELQANLIEPNAPVAVESVSENKKLSFWENLRSDYAVATPIQKVLVVGLVLISITLLAMIIIFALPIKTPESTPLPVVSSSLPNPRALQLPGGWIFDLKAGVVNEGSWKPGGPEWLDGTEICRLISLPWNPQLDAVYQTFQPGDELLLTMSNTDLLRYQIAELKTLDLVDFNSDDLNQVAQATTPCLVIVLTRDKTETRQMLVAAPVIAPPWQANETATSAIVPTTNPSFPTATLPAPPSTPTPTKSAAVTPSGTKP